MTGAFRTASGGRIDRARPIHFSFDGRRYQGARGDTLASALLANGVHLVGRSFKYHRPRGIVSAGAEEPNALVTIDRGPGRRTPNLRATQVELYDGLRATSQNCWPSPRFDLGALAGLAAPLLSAGFYYKTFMGPGWLGPDWAWTRLYEPLIRRAAGLGRAPPDEDADTYAHRYAHCDTLVVGGGPAGLAAALAASAGGARVILCEQQAELGGALLADPRAMVEDLPAQAWLTDVTGQLAARPHMRMLTRTQAFGYYPGHFLGLVESLTDHEPPGAAPRPRERLWQVRAGRVILATGAIERPLVFPGNDRPGIMLAGAARTYLNRYGVKPGTRAVIACIDDGGYEAALDLAAAGIAIAAIADQRGDSPVAAQARAAGLRVLPGTIVVGTSGRLRVSSTRLRLSGGGEEDIACDLLLMAGGWTPQVHLFSQSRGTLRFDEALQAFLPGAPTPGVIPAGACHGAFELAQCVAQGHAAGSGATVTPAMHHAPAVTQAITDPRDDAKAFVDFQNDVTARDIRMATAEGFRSIEHVKRYTTAGMATDQGKTSNMNALAVAAAAIGAAIPAVGLTTFRPPYTPVSFGALAGPARDGLFDPARVTPLHDAAVAEGAVFEDAGSWKRARYFPHAGETMDAAVARECRAVRGAAGIFDASTLGKIEVTGPDAGAFLDRLYPSDIAGLAPGRCRYALMLSEAGFVIDDGVIARLAPDRFHVTTTTAGAARALHHMEDYLQTEFTGLKAWLTSVTEQWAVIAVNGPLARRILSPLIEGIDLSPAAMPHMSVRVGRIAGVETRLARVSFTGELGFEVNVPARHGAAIWAAIRAAAAALGAAPYGTEAMHVLRAEKGYIIVGQETDGTVIPADLGLARAARKADFIGKRSLARSDMVAPDRPQLVGLLPRDPAFVPEEGTQIVAAARAPAGTRALGHVTSAYHSATLGRSIALALVAGGRSRIGDTLVIAGADAPVDVREPVFYDREGARLHD